MWFDILVRFWIFLAVSIFFFLTLTGIKAPYGRHVSGKWGKMIANRWGWFLMEVPALLLFPILVFAGSIDLYMTSWILLAMWLIHYFYRTLIFPFKLKTEGKKIPVLIVVLAILFNGMNGFINGYYIGFLDHSGAHHLTLTTILGGIVFITGLIINRRSDNYLIALRQLKKGYYIPRGWLFDRISCPNHFGEILEWIGFAIVGWSLPAVSFAIWTLCNLVPRALNHHRWYHKEFDNYPKDRKAVIPFIL